ncbi:MAG TPA: hypothetical protein DCM64_12045, partial [Gammaproteobacteria bacterium]|nr:hypothetical protein [Gammaproteobacteria bacterium]
MKSVQQATVVSILVTLLTSCGGDDGGNTSEVEQTGTTDNAGMVERVDPRLDALVPVDANIEKLAGGFAFTEGPVW